MGNEEARISNFIYVDIDFDKILLVNNSEQSNNEVQVAENPIGNFNNGNQNNRGFYHIQHLINEISNPNNNQSAN